MSAILDVFLPDLLAQRAAREGSETTYLEEVNGRQLSWREAHVEADAWAARLESLGVNPGDRVLTMMPTSAASVTVWVGIARLGAIEVPVNTELVGALLEHVVRDADPCVAIVASAYVPVIAPVLKTAGVPRIVVSDGPSAGADEYGFDVVEVGPPVLGRHPAPRRIEPWHTALILYTSGTTGPSKGVIVPWGQLHETAAASIPLDDLGADDAFYCPFGMAHVTARSGAFFAAILGGRLVTRPRFSLGEYWSDVARYRCTTTVLMGTMAHLLDRQPPSPTDRDTPMRNVLVAPLIPGIHAFAERFGLRVCTVFNMTEVSVPIASPGWALEDEHSCGRVRPGYECRIVDEHDRPVPPGTVGELVVRHREPWKLMAGYWRDPAKTAESWRNLWFHTGDAMSCDEEGRFTFRDRIKDVIRRRGENVSSIELEEQANAHPDVAESAAIGIPSELGEEDIALVVVPVSDAFEPRNLIAFLRDRVPRYMVPRYIRTIEELPRTATQKLDKKALRSRGVDDSMWDREAENASRRSHAS